MEKMETFGDRVIIDTDVLVDVLRGSEKVTKFVAGFEREGVALATTVINAFELYYGAYKSKKKHQNLIATKKLLERMVVLKMTLKSAEEAGKIHVELESKGTPIGIRDVMIGAIAISKGCPLVTRNTTHLQKIRGLNLIAVP
ncbi:MAG: type II toxin-antitoxin system VapC family toxin [Candidatus Methanomethylicaceae archaeon]